MPTQPAVSLSVAGASVRFGSIDAVLGVDLELREGEVLGVLGPSGSGKSTLLRAIAGLETLSAGSVCWEGSDLAGVPVHRRGFALMFQDGQLFDHLSVAGNVGYPLRLRLRRTPRDETQRRVDELLELVGLAGYQPRLPRTLSGGERQRVALARSLAADPRLLLLDEPLSSLDASLRTRLAADLRAILTSSGTTALMVTHDQAEAFAVADRVAVMRAGRVVQQGATADVWRAPVDVETALFLGYTRVLEGDAAALLVHAAGMSETRPHAAAVRRSALQAVDDPSAGQLHGVVLTVAPTPDEVRLGVEIDGIGKIEAVGSPGRRLQPGDAVALRVDSARIAVLGSARP